MINPILFLVTIESYGTVKDDDSEECGRSGMNPWFAPSITESRDGYISLANSDTS